MTVHTKKKQRYLFKMANEGMRWNHAEDELYTVSPHKHPKLFFPSIVPSRINTDNLALEEKIK